MGLDLLKVANTCSQDRSVRAVLITGTGKGFCAGGDLKSFVEAGDRVGEVILETTTSFHAAISRFNRMDAPVIAAVNGVAAGAGFSLACATDLAIAAESATFLSAYTAAGLVPDGSSTYFVSRMVGVRRAKELALTNRVLSAAEALDWGMVNRVVPDEELESASLAWATELASGATAALGRAKRLILDGMSESLETQMERESQEIAAVTRTKDAREGLTAFLEKRKPSFKYE